MVLGQNVPVSVETEHGSACTITGFRFEIYGIKAEDPSVRIPLQQVSLPIRSRGLHFVVHPLHLDT